MATPEEAARPRSLFDRMANGLAYCRVIAEGPRPYDFEYLEVNDAFERLTGLRGAVGKKVSELIPGIRESDAAVLERYTEVATTGKPRQFEEYVAALDRWFLISAYCPEIGYVVAIFDVIEPPTKREPGAPLTPARAFVPPAGTALRLSVDVPPPAEARGLVFSVGQDIEERERAAEATREAQERLEQIATRLPGVVYQYRLRPDGTSCFPFASEAIRNIYRVTPDEVREDASKVFANLHPDDVAAVTVSILASARDLTPWQHEYRVRFSDGTVRSLYGNALPHREEDGSVLWHGFITDVTERKAVDDALRASEATLSAVLENVDAFIYLKDREGRYLFANRLVRELFGVPMKGVVGHTDADFFDAASVAAIHAKDRIVLDEGQTLHTEETTTSLSEGRIATYLSTKLPLRGAGGAIYALCGISTDITERKELERQLHAKHEQLAALNASLEDRIGEAVAELRAKDQMLITQSRHAAMGEMIGNIAHQWRQPLNTLGLVLSNLLDAARFGELDAPAVEAAVAHSKRLIQKMSTTITDFRSFFQPAKERSVFSTRGQVAETQKLVDASFRNAGIELEVEDGADLLVSGFANEYSQVLLNLLSNAKEAIEQAGVKGGRVTVALTAEDGMGRLTVRDNGGGIAPAILDKVFDPYFSTKRGGTGIGLYMSRQIVERSMGGRLEVRNVDSGAEFAVVTPLAEGALPPPAEPESAP
jgi:PAS domain S-box-containing protein